MGVFNNYIKTDKLELTDVNSKIDNTNSKIDNVNSRIDSLEIGGRNLLTGTDTGVGYTYYKDPSSSENNAYFDNENKCFVLKAAYTGTSYVDSINMFSPYISLNKGQYTLSFDLKSDTPINRMQIFYIVYDSIGDMNSSKSTAFSTPTYDTKIDNYIKYKYTFYVPEDYPIIKIRIDNDHKATHTEDQTIYIKNLKLEKGHKATDWTPAPEDVEVAINENKHNIEELMNGVPVITLVPDGDFYIKPNVMYDIYPNASDNTTVLNIDVEDTAYDGIKHYMMRVHFQEDSFDNTINIEGSITWYGGVDPTWQAGKTYEISIIDGLAMWIEF